MFNINFHKLVVLLLPTFLRKAKLVAYLTALITPVKIMYDDFVAARAANLYKLAHNGQVCYLRKALNDSFDPAQRRIIITDGNRYAREYIYTHAEKQPKYLGSMMLRPASDYDDAGIDFRVICPKELQGKGKPYQLMALVDFYKLASKRYVIEYE